MSYELIEWADFEEGGTPLSAENLNHMDEGIKSAHEIAEAKQDKLVAGENITIDEETNVISSTGGVTEEEVDEKIAETEARLEDKITYRISTNAVDTSFNLPTVEGGIKLNKVVGKSYKSKNIMKTVPLSAVTTDGVTFTPVYGSNGELKYINLKGTATNTTYYRLSFVTHYATSAFSFKPNTKYAARKFNSNSNVNLCIGVFRESDTSKYTDLVKVGNYAPTFFQTANDIISRVYIQVLKDAVFNDEKIYPAIYLESEDTDTYEPYGLFNSGDSGEIVVEETNENLLIPTLGTTTQNGITCTNNGDGTYTLNGTSSAKVKLTVFSQSKFLKANVQYKLIGFNMIGSANTFSLILEEYVNGSWKTSVARDTGSGAIFTATDSYATNETRISIEILAGQTFNNVVVKPMLTTNLSATYDDFVKAETNTTIIPLNEPLYEQNVIDVENGVIEKKYARIVFDGSADENWTRYETSVSGKYRFGITVPQTPKFVTQDYIPHMFCNRLNIVTVNDIWNVRKEGISVLANNQIVIYTEATAAMSTTDFKSWLASNPVTEVYELATPTTEPLTDEQIEALHSVVSFKGRTLIDTADVYAKATLDLDYPVDIIGYINDLLAPQTASVMSLSEPIEVENEEES